MNAPTVIEAEAPVAKRFAFPKKAWKVGLIALLVAAAGIWWLTSPRTAESTDNAYLQADSSTVAPKVGGLVAAATSSAIRPTFQAFAGKAKRLATGASASITVGAFMA